MPSQTPKFELAVLDPLAPVLNGEQNINLIDTSTKNINISKNLE
jgi:hypothetical protein